MTNPYNQISGRRLERVFYVALFVVVLSLLCVSFVVVLSAHEEKIKWINSFGLTLEIIGVVLASFVVFFPRKSDATSETVDITDIVDQYVQEADRMYEQKHSLKMLFGAVLIVYGFIVQLVGNWV